MLTYRESKADKACNLECLQDKPPVHEFIGPVKIVLMDIPTKVYKRKMWLAAFIGLANLMIGATIITIMYFLLAVKAALMPTLHIFLCTFGFQLFIPMGILMMSNLHGPASQMKYKDHRKHHVIIQVIGWLLAVGGSVLGFLTDKGFELVLTPHSIVDVGTELARSWPLGLHGGVSLALMLKSLETHALDKMNKKMNLGILPNVGEEPIAQPIGPNGLVTAALSVLSVISGPPLFCQTERIDIITYLKGCHVFFAVPTFVASSVCFVLGLFFSKTFNEWLPMIEMLYIPIIFCILYTLIIIYLPTKKLFSPDLT